MEIKVHHTGSSRIAEVISDNIIIQSIEDGADLMGHLYYQDFGKVILYEKNICPDFFDLRTGMAGDILQKFSNYRIRLAIIGNFKKYESQSLRDFIFESNKGRQINFIDDLSAALEHMKS